MFPSQTFPQKYFVCKSYLKIKLIRCTILNVCLFWIFQFVFFSVKYHTLCLYLQPQSTYCVTKNVCPICLGYGAQPYNSLCFTVSTDREAACLLLMLL